MAIVESLRSGLRPEWKTRKRAEFHRAPRAKKAALEKAETLNARGVEEALRRDLGKAVVPELIRQTIKERGEADRAGNFGVCLRHHHS